MTNLRQSSANKIIFIARKTFYNTPVMRWKLTTFIYDKVFSFGAPDLSKPIDFRGSKFYVDPRDRSYVPTMIAGYYEKLELDIFTAVATQSRTLLDVGANIGMYAVLAGAANEKLSSYAFEPVLENQNFLKRNIKLNKLSKQITLVPIAVSKQDGFAMIHMSKTSSGTHSLAVEHDGESRKVKTMSLDSFCSKNKLSPELIKIDVEGHEASVFAGMKRLMKTKPTIFMEYIPEINKDMADLIKELGQIYGHCYTVDEVKNIVAKVQLKEIDQRRMYNIILTKNKSHIKAIEAYLT